MTGSDDESLNALEHNNAKQGANSYYFAHAKRNTGEAPAPDPVLGGVRIDKLSLQNVDDKFASQFPGEAPAPPSIDGGVRIASSQEPAAVPPGPQMTTKPITSFLFSDEDETVKIYIPLEGVKERVTAANVTATYGPQSMEFGVVGYEPDLQLKLLVTKLAGKIDPEASKHRILANKIVITLTKDQSDPNAYKPWTKLTFR